MTKSRRKYSNSEKPRLLNEVTTRVFNGETILNVCHDLGIPVQNYYRWTKKTASEGSLGEAQGSPSISSGAPEMIIMEQQRKIEDLERRLGQLSYQNLVLQEKLRGS